MSVKPSRAVWSARLILLLATAAIITPLIYLLGISLKPPSAIFDTVLSPFAANITLENYAAVLETVPVFRYLYNSILFSAGVALGQVILAVPAAFALAIISFR